MQPDTPALVICEHCDAVYRRRVLARGEKACCLRCGAELYRHQRLGVNSILALSIASLIALAMANLWPVVTIGSSGLHSTSMFWGAVVAAWHQHVRIVAALVAICLFFAPLVQLGLLAWGCAFIRLGRRPPGLVQVVRIVRWLEPWSMVEVLMLGILVAVAKLGSVFDVIPGVGLWAFAAVMVFMTLIESWDVRELWDAAPEDGA